MGDLMESTNTLGSSDGVIEQSGGVAVPMTSSTNEAPKSCSADSTQQGSSSKMRIDPMQLLTCLRVLLNERGGIRSNSEVKRVAGLMGKYSKKLVSKCIYLNILEHTDTQLLDEFYNEAGWDLVCAWLAEAVEVKNWPLTQLIMELLEISPVNVERLKQNNAPKIIKDLSKGAEREGIKKLSEKVLDHWKVLVGVVNSVPKDGTPLVTHAPQPEVSDTAGVSVVPEEPVEVSKPPATVSRRGRRVASAVRGKRKRGRPTKAEALSYAQLLNDGIEEKPHPPDEPPIKLTIRNIPQLLADSEERLKNRKISVESTDSDDVPLIKLRKSRSRRAATINISSSEESDGTADDTEGKIETETPDDTAPSDVGSEAPQSSPPASSAKEAVARQDSVSSEKSEPQEQDVPTKEDKPLVSKFLKKSSDQTDSSVSDKEEERDAKSSKKNGSSEDSKKHKDDSSKKRSSSSDSKSKDKHKSSHKDKLHKSSKDKKREYEKHKSRDKSSSSSKDKTKNSSLNSSLNSSSDKLSVEKNIQAKKDQATLNKLKPFSTDGLAKIPKKSSTPTSFLDALSAPDDTKDLKRPAVKTKSRGFRSSGLLEDIVKQPGVAGKRSIKVENHRPGVSLKRPTSLDSPRPEKKVKPSVSSEPATSDRPGGVKLMSPKRPVLADDGGFMAALTAAGSVDRKKIPRKRRVSETDVRNDKAKIPRTEPTATPEEQMPTVEESPEKTQSPVIAPMNFYKDTLSEKLEADKKEESKVVTSQEEKPETEEKPKEETVDEETLPEVQTIPAPAQEDYETIDVHFSVPPVDTKGVLVFHRPANRKKKTVKWKTEEDIKEIFYFPMDENERVNVNNIKFQDMIEREKAKEKEMMGRNRLGSPPFEPAMPEKSIEFIPWKIYPIMFLDPPSLVPGCNSNERHVQAQREQNVMGAFFNPSMLPETPSEPDPELAPREEPPIIPLTDVTGADIIKDLRDVPWPESSAIPNETPFMAPPRQLPHEIPTEGSSGGHWVVGSQVSRFSAPMFNGPTNASGPPRPPFSGQSFNEDFRGRWVQQGTRPPAEFRAPPMMMPGGPPMPPMGPRGPGLVRGGGPGPRFKRNNWGPPTGGHPRPCIHFMNGHCRNGNNCRFGHTQPR